MVVDVVAVDSAANAGSDTLQFCQAAEGVTLHVDASFQMRAAQIITASGGATHRNRPARAFHWQPIQRPRNRPPLARRRTLRQRGRPRSTPPGDTLGLMGLPCLPAPSSPTRVCRSRCRRSARFTTTGSRPAWASPTPSSFRASRRRWPARRGRWCCRPIRSRAGTAVDLQRFGVGQARYGIGDDQHVDRLGDESAAVGLPAPRSRAARSRATCCFATTARA